MTSNKKSFLKHQTSSSSLSASTSTGVTPQQQQQQQQLSFSDASVITLLLSDHESFGFSERACYHFDLIETLTQTPESKSNHNNSKDTKTKTNTNNGKLLSPIGEHQDKKEKNDIRNHDSNENENEKEKDHDNSNTTQLEQFPQASTSCCGVVSLLECISHIPMIRQPKKRRWLNKKIKDFNKHAEDKRNQHQKEGKNYCHQPNEFPLHLTIHTRVAFAYELTRMVFCIDASPTLTATFGNLGTLQQADDDAICAIDRLDDMARLFFTGLVQPIKRVSRAEVQQGNSNRLVTRSSWFPEIAVTVVACYPKSIISNVDEEAFSILVGDYRIHDMKSANNLCDKLAHWVAMEVESSIAAKFSKTGGRLDSSSSSLKQIIETCTACDAATLPPEARPCFVIATDCRAIDCDSVLDVVTDENLKDVPLHIIDLSGNKTHRTRYSTHYDDPFNLKYDHDGPSSFPLSIPDDSEALYNVCKSTRGQFFDIELLKGAYNTISGEVGGDSPFHDDVYFSFKRRTMRPNGLQWYIVFCLSPCCTLPLKTWAPKYIQQRREIQKQPDKQKQPDQQKQMEPVMFCKYNLKPIRVKSLLTMRIMDGFRTRRYGSTSQDADKVSIQFTLDIDMRTTIHYELNFISDRFHNAMVGRATVKISLSGEPSFIQMVNSKFNQFNRSVIKTRMSAKDIVSNKICNFLEWVRDEDKLESTLCPLDWENKLSDDSLFMTSLHDLKSKHIYRHFRLESFDVIYILASEVDMDEKSAERKLVDLISSWSTKTIAHGRLYIRQLPTTEGELTNYCLVEIIRSDQDLRAYTINMHFFEQVDSQCRISFFDSLKNTIASFETLFIISPRSLSKCIFPRINLSKRTSVYGAINLYQFESWKLLNDPELFLLITKRRCQFDQFLPIFVTTGNIILVKFVRDFSNNLCLVQYCFRKVKDEVIVNLFMDYERGDFSKAFRRYNVSSSPTLFSEIHGNIMERDQKCARALRSRRNLLNLFDEEKKAPRLVRNNLRDDVERLLLYAQKFIIKLRFFEELGKANEILERLTINFILSGSLNAEVIELSVENSEYAVIPGKWFLIRLDDNAFLSLFHFPCKEIVDETATTGEHFAFRELTIFTVATSNLYFYQSDFNENTRDFSLDYHDKISSLGEEIEAAHGRNYSLASYLALRYPSPHYNTRFTPLDFEYALASCEEHQITGDVEVKSNPDIDEDQSKFDTKLTATIGEILKPVPGGSPYFYFSGEINDNNEISNAQVSNENDNDSKRKLKEESKSNSSEPLFVSFTLDRKLVSLEELRNFSSLQNQSSVLNAFMTTFKDPNLRGSKQVQGRLPKVHNVVARNLVARLSSFVAEQTLERLWREHRALKDINCNSVKRCLVEAENVCFTTIPVHFYFSKTDSMLDASTSIGVEGDFQQGFALLCACISEQRNLVVTEVSSGEFFAANVEEVGWCFIDVPENYGCVSIDVYHPAGLEVAEKVAMTALRVVGDACHSANQILILEHMHKTRTGSTLMIPEHNIVMSQSQLLNNYQLQKNSSPEYPAGYFQCDESFKTSYSLNRRCKLSSVIIDLESSVLHTFALSNRGGIFVYKDEKDCVMYMKLLPQPVGEKGVDKVDFIVYGTQPAGPSITVQLNRLLQKKLMLICSDAISLVLTKNPHYNLWDSDLQFIHSFSREWKKLEHSETDSKEEEIYTFPVAVYDPAMVLIYFRQNISGSKFFNTISIDGQVSEDHDNQDQHQNSDDPNGIPFIFNRQEFNLCYNASQFQLSKFQPTSTLTEVGRQYSRDAGTGIALIEIKLLDSNNVPLECSNVGRTQDEGLFPTQKGPLRFRKLQKDEKTPSQFRLSVRIINTTLKTDPLHNWIELTLNQALVAWGMERDLEKSGFGVNSFVPSTIIRFADTVQSSLNIPHPAIRKFEFTGNVRSTDLSTLTFHLLDLLLNNLFDGKKRHVNDVHGLQTVRMCNDIPPHLVRLYPLPSCPTVHTVDFSTNELILDNPAMTPRYISSFGLSLENENIPISSFLFQKVFLIDNQGSLSHALTQLMNSNPYAFVRRIAFLLVVTRTSTTFFFYNLNPNLYETMISGLQEKYNEFNASQEQRPVTKSHGVSEGLSTRSIDTRSRSIVMPTIVGKSVKGSAAQAMSMSRARARTTTTGRSNMSNKPTNPAPRVVQRSTWKARNNKKNPKSSNKDSNEILKSLPSSLAKEYMTVHAIVSKMTFNDSIAIYLLQQMFLSWLLKQKGKEAPVHAMDFILRHANFVKTETFPLIKSIVDDPFPLLAYLTKVILSHDPDTKLLAKTFSSKNENMPKHNVKNPTMYMMRKFSSSIQECIILIYEVSVISHINLGKIGRCRSWTFITCNDDKNIPSLVEMEKIMSSLNLRGKMFNFVSSVLRGAVKHYSYMKHNLDVPSILRETRIIFPARIQRRTRIGTWFRLFYRTVLWEDSDDFPTVDHFIDYVISNHEVYGLCDCSGFEKCIVGQVCGNIEDAHFFMTPRSQTQDEKAITFNLFVISYTHGRDLESYFFEKDSFYAKKHSHYIIDMAKKTVLNILETASIDFRRDQMWVEQSDWV